MRETESFLVAVQNNAIRTVTRWVAFISVSVAECQSEDSFVFWCETHTKSLRVRSPMRQEEDEGRKVSGRAEKESVKRSGQSTEDEGSWRSRKAAARTCRLRCRVGQREKMSQHFFVALWEFRSNTRSGRCTKVLKTTTGLGRWSNESNKNQDFAK